MTYVAFFVGLSLGACVGVLVMAVLAVAKDKESV